MNAMNVKVVEAGGTNVNVPITPSSTVEMVLRAAGIDTSTSKQIRLNDAVADLNAIVHDGDTIYLVPNIKGNK